MKFRQSMISYAAGAAVLLMALLLGYSVFNANKAIGDQQRAFQHQAEFKQLGGDIAGSSDLLLRVIREFVVTGQQEYLDAYWTEVDVTQTQAHALDRLRELGATDEEFALLETASQKSDALIATEIRAMRLRLEADAVVEAEMPAAVAAYSLSADDAALTDDAKRELATELVFDSEYQANVASILAPTIQFEDAMNGRMVAEVQSASDETNSAIRIMVILAVLLPLTMGGVLWLFHSKVGVPVSRYIRALGDRDASDLDFALTPDGTVEMQSLAEAFNAQFAENQQALRANGELVGRLQGLIHEVRSSADVVASTSTETLALTEQIAAATMEVTSTIQDVAHGSAGQADQMTTVAHAFDQMNQTVDAVARGAAEQGKTLQRSVELTEVIAEQNARVAQAAAAGMENAQRNAERAREGDAIVRRTVTAMSDVRQRVDLAAARVAEMGERSKQIGAIVSIIEDVTEQTNLLALNAAIEAARAGEAGKGFAVVAEEVRKLAERSSASTHEIAQLVTGVEQSVIDAVAAMGEGTRGVDVVSGETEAVRSAFEGILAAAGELEQQTREISSSAEATVERTKDLQARMEDTSAIAEENSAAAAEMSQTAVQVRHGMQSVSAVTEQNAAAAEEVSAATAQTASQLEEVTATAQNLQRLAQNLQQLVAGFQMSDGTGEQSRTETMPGTVVPRRRASDWNASPESRAKRGA